jgi:putative transposase
MRGKTGGTAPGRGYTGSKASAYSTRNLRGRSQRPSPGDFTGIGNERCYGRTPDAAQQQSQGDWNHSAQGCPAKREATLGWRRKKIINPERVESSMGFAHPFTMPQSLAKILVHTVFSTKDRRPFLRDGALREELHRYLGGILANLDCQPVIIGGVEDHVHLLCALSRTCEAAEMVKEVKRGSSTWIKSRSSDLQDFAWQNGYGIFSIGFSQIESVRTYIARQAEHHRKASFQDELRLLLKRYEIEFDERYLWD